MLTSINIWVPFEHVNKVRRLLVHDAPGTLALDFSRPFADRNRVFNPLRSPGRGSKVDEIIVGSIEPDKPFGFTSRLPSKTSRTRKRSVGNS
jgi:hypothetical protein